jgi:hypothetical protein
MIRAIWRILRRPKPPRRKAMPYVQTVKHSNMRPSTGPRDQWEMDQIARANEGQIEDTTCNLQKK